jgi:signal transduction histidine kinase
VSQEPKPVDARAFYRVQLSPESFQTLTTACAQVPEFRELVDAPSSVAFMARAIEGVQRRVEWTLEDWIVHVTVGYLDGLCEGQSCTWDNLKPLAREVYFLGSSPFGREPIEDDCKLNDGTSANRWFCDHGERGDCKFANVLVHHYFLAHRVAADHGRDLLSVEFPRRWVLMFLAVLAPDLTARATAQRSSEMRAEIEQEVEQRVQAALSHQLKRSAGAVRSNLKKIRSKISQDQFKRVSTEYDRILQESQFQIDLAERTGMWSAELELRIEPTRVLPVVEDAVVSLRERFPDIELRVDVAAVLMAQGDARWIREILFNLAENALQAVTCGPPDRPRQVVVRGVVEGQHVRLEVLDSGAGVHPADAERIFQPRVTSKKGGDRQPLGTGMGLPIARRYAELMGGRLNIRLGEPLTCFFVELPRADTEEP